MASHKPPSRLRSNARTPWLELTPNARGEKDSNCAPSNRASLERLAAHKNPSGVCARLVMVLLGRPSSSCQVCRDHVELVAVAGIARPRSSMKTAKTQQRIARLGGGDTCRL